VRQEAIDDMCLALVATAIDDEEYLKRLKIPDAFWPLISDSWERDEGSLYGRLDLSFDGQGPPKLLEYNADTPTSIFEAAVFNGAGSNSRSSAASSRRIPINSTRSTSA
jgi:glutathionylspermidine synthase